MTVNDIYTWEGLEYMKSTLSYLPSLSCDVVKMPSLTQVLKRSFMDALHSFPVYVDCMLYLSIYICYGSAFM